LLKNSKFEIQPLKGLDVDALAASLKRCPDTKASFSANGKASVKPKAQSLKPRA
jgi:hypothetical protein